MINVPIVQQYLCIELNLLCCHVLISDKHLRRLREALRRRNRRVIRAQRGSYVKGFVVVLICEDVIFLLERAVAPTIIYV